MKQLLWLVDARNKLKNSSIDKAIQLATALQAPIHIIADKRVRAVERWYWKTLDDSEAARQHNAQQQQTLSYIVRQLNDNDIAHKLTQISDSNCLPVLMQHINADTLLLIQDEEPSLRHPLFQQLSKLKCPVLVMQKQPWHQPLKISVAVDPMHSNDEAAQLDQLILHSSQQLIKKLKAKWQVIHSCFTPAVFLEHKKAIVKIHQESLEDLLKKMGIKKDLATLLEGPPEQALVKNVKNEHTDILCLGLVARHPVELFLVGSTAHALLQAPPCDLLLIQQP